MYPVASPSPCLAGSGGGGTREGKRPPQGHTAPGLGPPWLQVRVPALAVPPLTVQLPHLYGDPVAPCWVIIKQTGTEKVLRTCERWSRGTGGPLWTWMIPRGGGG